MKLIRVAIGIAALGSIAFAGCKSPHVEVTVQNQTGVEVRLLEVDYPNASFGKDSLAPGASMHYRVQLQGSGPIKVQYGDPESKHPQMTGPEVHEGQAGQLEIVLLPLGKAEFHPQLSGGR